jgi:Acyl-CoA reductase (LuxC)
MTAVQQVIPDARRREMADVLDDLAGAPQLRPFADEAVAFCDALSRRLFRDPAGRAHPEIHVLAYWLRRASVHRLHEAFDEESTPGTVLSPRGLVFHVPPTNVDTMTLYSLALSLLTGNRNLVRISPRRNAQMDALLPALHETLADKRFAALRAGTAVVSYGHEDEPTALASSAGDVRVLWGGDETVTRLRQFPLRPDAKDVVFPDRFSFAVVDACAWLDATETRRDELAKALYDDAYWFDQMGCASPRLLVWCGEPEAAADAGDDLYSRLADVILERGYALETGAVITKLTYAFAAAADRPVTSARREHNELTVLRLESLNAFDRTHPGAGLFFEAVVPELADLTTFITRKDQTMTAFGFADEELRAFVAAANGRGVDRIVPFGQALAFDRLWDGMDLLSELTRRVVVVSSVTARALAVAR